MPITLDELKAEADRLGYKLVKKKPYEQKFLPCICGNNEGRFHRGWTNDDYYYRTCPRCGFTARFHKSELKKPRGSQDTMIKLVWNEAIANTRD